MTFDEFFSALNGLNPFPWQTRLAMEVIENGWPKVLDLPTGVGKTSAIEISLFHLMNQLAAIRDGKLQQRTAPLRIFFVVDRRIVVDGAYEHALALAEKLRTAEAGVLAEASTLLCEHFGVERPLHVSLMRGGMYRDSGWAINPVQPTICVSTVDQVGSRLLFRGYGVTPSMRPIHAGLVGNDSLLLLDEAHLSNPFLQTLQAVRLFSNKRFAEQPVSRPLQVVQMSATTADNNASHESAGPFRLDDEDRRHEILERRLTASKVAKIEKIKVNKDDRKQADEEFAKAIVSRAVSLSTLNNDSTKGKGEKRRTPSSAASNARVIGIVVNRVRMARMVFDLLRHRSDVRDPLNSETDLNEVDAKQADVVLLTGRIRPADRDELLFRQPVRGKQGWLAWIKAGRDENPANPIFVVATQTVEVGADIDFDALVTEAAPLDCLRQRFGRLDRRGKRGQSSAFILGRSTDVARTAKDRVYGNRLSSTWQWLESKATGKGKNKSIDFGVNAMEQTMAGEKLDPLCAERQKAPVLLPPYLKLWARTNPMPMADPDVGLFLHGPQSRPPDVQVVWRADLLAIGENRLDHKNTKRYVNTVSLLPPTSMEACPVPLHEVQRWLQEEDTVAGVGDLADVEGDTAPESAEGRRKSKAGKHVLRWKDEEKSQVDPAIAIRPGETIIVPTSYGGHDRFGWNPAAKFARDIGETAARLGRAKPVVRFHPGLLAKDQWNIRLEEFKPDEVENEADTQALLDELIRSETVPELVKKSCRWLLDNDFNRWTPYRDSDGSDLDIPDDGWILSARKRLPIETVLQETRGQWLADGDDYVPDSTDGSSLRSFRPVTLSEHTAGVVKHVCKFSRLAGLPASVSESVSADLKLAARWHDVGKIDERFQTLLHDGDAAAAMIALAGGGPLAKSGQGYIHPAERRRARMRAGLPDGFRHEALSVILLRESSLRSVLDDANDSEFVQYVIGSHHGNGRSSHPVVDDQPEPIDAQLNSHSISISADEQVSAALYRLENEWESLFARMNDRYGWWGLAWLEAMFRLADHTQSALEARTKQEDETIEVQI